MRVFAFILTAIIATGAVAVPAIAQQDGALVALHTLRKEGRSICMVGHYHLGTSSGASTRKLAALAAMRDWSGFTAWEYGSHWGSAKRAKNKSMSCQRLSRGWSCDFNARPCKPAQSGRVAGRRR